MARIVVPELGESIVEATVAQWLKQEGEAVAAGEAVVRLETDKVDLEVGSDRAGILARIERQEGEDVKVGEVLAILEEAAAGAQTQAAPPPAQGREVPAQAGKPETAREAVQPAPETPPSPDRTAPPPRDDRVTPVARRIAEEHDVDLAQVAGSGPQGRVTKEDVEHHLAGIQAPPRTAEGAEVTAPARQAPSAPAPQPPISVDRQAREERVRMSRRRQTIAQRLVEAQRTAAMLTTFNEADMGLMMQLRARRKEAFRERHGVSLGIMAFFVKATIGALKAFPRLNAELQGNEIVLKHYYDIGIAVGASEGLVVPVLRDADRMSFAAIEQRIKDFAQQTESGTLALEDLQGGTFTITNGGVFGSLLSTPILNPPQVGILGLHKIEERPVAHEGQVVLRPMMYLALTYDHRIVDGREAVQFLVRVKELIEDPESLLIEG